MPAPGMDDNRTERDDRKGSAPARGAQTLEFIPPMLPTPVSALPTGPEWRYELKLDGFRAELLRDAGAIRLVSRNGKDLSKRFAVMARELGALPSGLILDGEIVALDKEGRPALEKLQSFSAARDAPLLYYAFDLLALNGKGLRRTPYLERKLKLNDLLTCHSLPSLRFVGAFACEPRIILDQARKAKLEGIVAKRTESIYRSGVSADWMKLRFSLDQEFVVGGFVMAGRRLEALLLGYYEGGKLQYSGRVSAGLSVVSRMALLQRLGAAPRRRESVFRFSGPLIGPTRRTNCMGCAGACGAGEVRTLEQRGSARMPGVPYDS
jgi:bifunctional non-homologous end joining protein LigD